MFDFDLLQCREWLKWIKCYVSKESYNIKKKTSWLGWLDILKQPKETLVLLLGERTMMGFYSLEGGPNESQKALEKEEWLHPALTELLRLAAHMICLLSGEKILLSLIYSYFISSVNTWTLCEALDYSPD